MGGVVESVGRVGGWGFGCGVLVCFILWFFVGFLCVLGWVVWYVLCCCLSVWIVCWCGEVLGVYFFCLDS